MSAASLPTRFYLARHGRVDPAWRGRVYGDLDVPLSDEGREEARRVAEVLSGQALAVVVSSGLARAEFGAACLRSERGLVRRDEPRLREISRGEWRGLSLEDLEQRFPGAWRRWYADPERERPPGGESLGDLAGRVVPCLEDLAREHPGREVAVVAHSWVVRVACCHALGLRPGAATRLDLATGALAVVDWPCDSAGELLRPVLAGYATASAPQRRPWQ